MVRLKLMPPLTRIVGTKEVAVDADRASLRAVIERAAAGNGRFRAALLDAEGNLSTEYSCLVNGRRYNASDLEGVEVGEEDDVVLLMPIAGGAPTCHNRLALFVPPIAQVVPADGCPLMLEPVPSNIASSGTVLLSGPPQKRDSRRAGATGPRQIRPQASRP